MRGKLQIILLRVISFIFSLANYQDSWQCISSFYGDGSASTSSPIPHPLSTASGQTSGSSLSAVLTSTLKDKGSW